MVARVRKVPKPHLMDGGARKWMYAYLWKNRWRLPVWMEWEDLVTFGIECYYVVRQRYPGAHDRAHIMALFKKVMLSQLTNMANAKTKEVEIDRYWGNRLFENDRIGRYGGANEDQAEAEPGIEAALDAVPTALRPLLVRLFEEWPSELPLQAERASQRDVMRSSLAAPYRRFDDGLETLNQRLCWLSGFDPKKINIVKVLCDHLRPSGVKQERIKYRHPTGKIRERLEALGCSPAQVEKHINSLRTSPRYRTVV